VIRQRVNAVVVDVAAAGHISARGLKMLLACAANQTLLNGSLIVVGARGAIRRTAKLVGLWGLACEASSVRSAIRKAEDYKSAQRAGETMLHNARSQSRRLARQAGAR